MTNATNATNVTNATNDAAFDYAQVLSDAGAQAYLCDATIKTLSDAIALDSWTAVMQAVIKGGMSPRAACTVLLDGYVQAFNAHESEVITAAPVLIRKRYNSYCSILTAALAQGLALVDSDGEFAAKGSLAALVVKKPTGTRSPKIPSQTSGQTEGADDSTSPVPATPALLTIDASVIGAVMEFLLNDSPEALFARQANAINFERLNYQLSRDAEATAKAEKAKNKALTGAMKILEKQQLQASV